MDKKDIDNLIKLWQEYTEKNNEFMLNPDREWVEKLALGVLTNESKTGLKYCPCRVTVGKRDQDLQLLCPCNFFSQQTWQTKGECWCGLFHKIKK